MVWSADGLTGCRFDGGLPRETMRALTLARPIAFFVYVLGPVLAAVEFVVGGVLRLFGLRAGEHSSVLSPQDELMSTVELLHSEGSVERRNRDMFGGLLELSELQVSDVMVHRTKMRTIEADQPGGFVQMRGRVDDGTVTAAPRAHQQLEHGFADLGARARAGDEDAIGCGVASRV